MEKQHETFLRLSSVTKRTGLSRTRIYEFIRMRKFPSSIQLGQRAVAWLESDIDAWMEARIAASRIDSNKVGA